MHDMQKRTWTEIDLSAIEDNVRAMRARLPKGCRYLGVIKANAYGHGAVPVARRLEEMGVEYLAVACLDEVSELRAAGITAPILILGVTPAEYASELVRLNAVQAVGSYAYAAALDTALRGTGQRLRVHLKLETGMGRTGFRAFGDDRLADAVRAMALETLEPEGVFTHFCVSDAEKPEREFTREQLARFLAAVERLESESGMKFFIRHCANSGAMLSFPETYLDMVRPGVAMYGLYPGADRGGLTLRPAMALYSRVYTVEEHFPGDTISYGRTFTATEPMRVAVVPIGYADGLHRALSDKLEFYIAGHRCRQIGRICMDMCMVDVTGTDIKSGDVVEVFGEHIPIDTLAEKAGTIHYEICCALSPRVPRIYRS